MATRKRRTRRRAPDDKRARILEAATEIVREHGAGALRTSQVAAAAQVSEGIIFNHFRNKRGLLLEVAARHGHAVATAMFEGLLPGQRPDVERMVRASFQHACDHGKLEQMLVMTDDLDTANQSIHAAKRVVVAALTQAFIQWQAAGFIETEHPDIAASLMFGMVSHGVHECVLHEGGERLEEYISECVACIEGALGYEAELGD